ncbi:radical SAM protein [Planctomycetota bacterium]
MLAMFEVTPRCLMRCPFCYNVWKTPGYPSGEELDLESIKHLAHTAINEFKVEDVIFSGGEPLLRSDLEHIVEIWKTAGTLRLRLATTGVGLNPALARGLASAGINVFMITLLHTDPAVHDGLFGHSGAFEQASLALANAAAGARAGTVYVATRQNRVDFNTYAKLVCALGGEFILINRFIPVAEGEKNRSALEIPAEDFTRLLTRAEQCGRQYNLQVSCALPFNREDTPPRLNALPVVPKCRAGYEKIAIDFMGNVRPCEQVPAIAGNLLTDPPAKIKKHLRLDAFGKSFTCPSL